MSKLRTFSICLSDIPKDAIYESEKNGKKYVSLMSWDNDEPDKYGNHFGISIAQSKEERDRREKKVYVGNGKIYGDQQPSVGSVKERNSNDLPF